MDEAERLWMELVARGEQHEKWLEEYDLKIQQVLAKDVDQWSYIDRLLMRAAVSTFRVVLSIEQEKRTKRQARAGA